MVVETEKLTKYYGQKLGCSDINLMIKKGEIFALLGHNGAGKSTFIKMLVGLIFPSSGKATVLGKPLGDVGIRKKIGYLPENFKYQDWMTGIDLLSFHASLYKLDKKESVSRIYEALETVKLRGQEKYKVGTYSKGMQQRIGIACALLSKPELLFLDEPTSALDPIGRKEVREIMVELKARGSTILLNSHLLSEVEIICNTAAFINRGKIVQCKNMDSILKDKASLEIVAENISQDILIKLRKLDNEMTYCSSNIKMTLPHSEDIPKVASLIINGGGSLFEMSSKKESLENIFIRLMKGDN